MYYTGQEAKATKQADAARVKAISLILTSK
jgi:hypothetical protein